MPETHVRTTRPITGSMLGLLAPTPKAWAEAAEADLPKLLADHAHCELKAAQSALSLLGRYGGEHPSIVAPLVALAREEAEHFEQVTERIDAEGATLGLPGVDAYVKRLRAAAKPEHPDVPILLDRLIISALIEGRSCERFKLLANSLQRADLRAFYKDLMESEARHHVLFTRLASEIFGAQASRERFTVLAERESEIASALPLGPTVHG